MKYENLPSNNNCRRQDLQQVQELYRNSEDIEKVHKTLETVEMRLPRCIQVLTLLIPALFVTVLRAGKLLLFPSLNITELRGQTVFVKAIRCLKSGE